MGNLLSVNDGINTIEYVYDTNANVILEHQGDKSVNSSIGSQWKGRIGELDAEACKAKSEGNGKDKMNAELNRCPKK